MEPGGSRPEREPMLSNKEKERIRNKGILFIHTVDLSDWAR